MSTPTLGFCFQKIVLTKSNPGPSHYAQGVNRRAAEDDKIVLVNSKIKKETQYDKSLMCTLKREVTEV